MSVGNHNHLSVCLSCLIGLRSEMLACVCSVTRPSVLLEPAEIAVFKAALPYLLKLDDPSERGQTTHATLSLFRTYFKTTLLLHAIYYFSCLFNKESFLI